jgi:hypothetical protein
MRAVERLRVWVIGLVALTTLVGCAGGPHGQMPIPGPPLSKTEVPSSQQVPQAPAPAPVPTVLILDGSGSMTQADAPGPRMDAAKAAARTLVNALPDGATLAVETYGTSTGSADSDKAAGCRDVTTLLQLAPLDRGAVAAAIDRIVPSGYTPISLALETAVNQLPTDAKPQAVVLVSDGEDTCDTPPCDTAARLKQSHPGLTISTVGFKLDGPAADQLRCVADVSGGIFVQAANANQLAARLLATQNIGEANSSLSSSGTEGIDLGAKISDIRSKHPDFPDATTTGAVIVVWRDCDFGFVDGILDSIRPHNGGRTIDGVGAGSAVSKAADLYGKPLATSANSDGTTSVIFDADPNTGAAYNMGVEGFSSQNGALSGTIKTIVLCRCKPHAAAAPPGPEQIVLKPVNAQGNTMPGYLKDESERDDPIDCSFGSPSSHDVTHGVRDCGITADSGDACWPTAGGAYVLCLGDPFKNVLTLRAATGVETPLRPPSGPPLPIGLVLDDGTQCRVRIGGAWPSPDAHPEWVGFYGCTVAGPDTFSAIWASRDSSDGIDHGPNGWTVQVGGEHGPLTARTVTKVYFVGMA